MATTLPRAPKTLGRLRHVFASAVDSVQGRPNQLGLPPSKLTIVLLVDGLGTHNLEFAAGHARYLNRLNKLEQKLSTVFPSTTASALVSFSTGLMPGQHGFVGYNLFDRTLGRSQNMLSGWTSAVDSQQWLTALVRNTTGIRSEAPTIFLGHSSYRESGFTGVIMPHAAFVAADQLSERFDKAIDLAKSGFRGVVYLYVAELDQTGHAFGPKSPEWLAQVELLDSNLARLGSSLKASQQVVVTADHGMVEVPLDQHIYWDEYSLEKPVFVGGDTRCNFVYLDESVDARSYAQALRNQLPQSVLVVSPSELETQGWLSAEHSLESRIPDLYLVCSGAGALYHRGFASYKSMKMLGHHGGISATELSVPGLLLLGEQS